MADAHLRHQFRAAPKMRDPAGIPFDKLG